MPYPNGRPPRARGLVPVLNACEHVDETCRGELHRHHTDLNPRNNVRENITVLCRKHHQDAHHGKGMKGERNPNARLTAGDVTAIRAAFEAGSTPVQLAQRFNVSDVHIRALVRRLGWVHI